MKLCFFNENIGTFKKKIIFHSFSVLRNIWLHVSLECPKSYILRYQIIKLDKNAKNMMSIFNGCRHKLEFFTACMGNKLYEVKFMLCSKKKLAYEAKSP